MTPKTNLEVKKESGDRPKELRCSIVKAYDSANEREIVNEFLIKNELHAPGLLYAGMDSATVKDLKNRRSISAFSVQQTFEQPEYTSMSSYSHPLEYALLTGHPVIVVYDGTKLEHPKGSMDFQYLPKEGHSLIGAVKAIVKIVTR